MWVVARPGAGDPELAVFAALTDAQAASAGTPGATLYHAEGARTVAEAQAMVRSGSITAWRPPRPKR